MLIHNLNRNLLDLVSTFKDVAQWKEKKEKEIKFSGDTVD